MNFVPIPVSLDLFRSSLLSFQLSHVVVVLQNCKLTLEQFCILTLRLESLLDTIHFLSSDIVPKWTMFSVANLFAMSVTGFCGDAFDERRLQKSTFWRREIQNYWKGRGQDHTKLSRHSPQSSRLVTMWCSS